MTENNNSDKINLINLFIIENNLKQFEDIIPKENDIVVFEETAYKYKTNTFLSKHIKTCKECTIHTKFCDSLFCGHIKDMVNNCLSKCKINEIQLPIDTIINIYSENNKSIAKVIKINDKTEACLNCIFKAKHTCCYINCIDVMREDNQTIRIIKIK